MTHTYNITGMTCGGCVAKVKKELLKIGGITEANVQLASPQATISMQKHLLVEDLQSVLRQVGNYKIIEADGGMHRATDLEKQKIWFQTYKPILLIFFYIATVSLIVATAGESFDWVEGMRIFMSGFFLVFSFFKLLDITGFADSYATYDIVAKHFRGWGFIYPFIELGLGLAYALNIEHLAVNAITFVVMSVSMAGVLQSVLNKRKIRCACLGAVFNLPMSTVTIIEDALMIGMSGVMLWMLV